jgi:trigger factor
VGLELQEIWNKRSKQEMETQLVTKLVDANNFPVPQTAVTRVIEGMAKDIQKRYEKMPNAKDLTAANLAESLRPLAERTVKWEIIREKIIDLEKIEIEDFDLDEVVEKEAERLKSDPNAIRSKLKSNEEFMDSMLLKKVMEFLLDFAETNEVSFDEFAQNSQFGMSEAEGMLAALHDDEDFDEHDHHDHEHHHHDHDGHEHHHHH